MKKIVLVLVVLSLCITCSSRKYNEEKALEPKGWVRYEFEDVGYLYLPKSLSSVDLLKYGMDSIAKKEMKHRFDVDFSGNLPYVFKPTKLIEQEEGMPQTTVSVSIQRKGKFREWDFEKDKRSEEVENRIYQKTLKSLPKLGINILKKDDSVSFEKINGYTCVRYSLLYAYEGDDNAVFMFSYQFDNYDERVIITIHYPMLELMEWGKDFRKIPQTFKFLR